MNSQGELLELARHLKQERLFVTSERQHLQSLNEKVLKTVERLFHVAWIAKQQRINLDGLILSKPDFSPALACQRANVLENVTFVDAYKHLGFHEPLYGEFLQQLRQTPKLVAVCLVIVEKMKIEVMHHLVNVVTASIYGHCVLQEDKNYVLNLLRHLMELQLATSDNPRRLLRHGSCAFSRVYKTFSEGLYSAKIFLTAALHDPILQLLMEDELFLDIDPGKAVVRFPAHERLRRFGKEGTSDYIANLQKYRYWTITKLVSLTNRFIAGIKENMFFFPPSLVWLVKQLYNIVMKAKKVEVREVGAICADLVFSFFICPAIVNPEPYSIISDTPISYIARFNLMQVAQILHVLAMSKWEEIDPKLMDLYGRFDKDCISSLLDAMLEGGVEDCPPANRAQLQGLTRSAILIAEPDLMSLVSLLRTVANECSSESDIRTLETLLANLPPSQATDVSHGASPELLPSNGSLVTSTPPTTPGSKRNILNKGKKSGKNYLSPSHDQADDRQKQDEEEAGSPLIPAEEVLVITLNNVIPECPGMLSEQKVLSIEQNKQGKVRMKLENLPNEEGNVNSGEMQEKRTRFSLSHDQDSVGTSDNLEAISEAASNHSVSSSLELENENDNLSDMVSANVSGRGTPNVSGRDTPSSQTGGEEREERPLNLPVTAMKQNQEDIDDKFGKFDIKPLIEGDETVSLVSDTWSTDVLASDSETQERPVVDDIPINAAGFLERQQGAMSLFGVHNLLDIEDKASEAWSTDVLASDSERMQDVDTDDTGSVARSDDTASVARSDDAPRSDDVTIDCVHSSAAEHSTDENVTPRASGSRSPVEGILPKTSPIVVTSKNGIRTANRILASIPAAVERLNFQPIREHQVEETDIDVRNNSTEAREELDKVNSLLESFDAFAPEVNRSPSDSEPGLKPNDVSISMSPVSDTWNREDSRVSTDLLGMQSLGRLSLSIGELPDNGILSTECTAFVATTQASIIVSDDASIAVAETSVTLEEVIDDSAATPLCSTLKENTNSALTDATTEHGENREPFVNARRDLKKCLSADARRLRIEERDTSCIIRLSTGSITSSISSSSSGSGPGDTGGKGDAASTQEATGGTVSSGAIPKSISFDKTAEKGDKDSFEGKDHKHKKGFFRSFKLPALGRNRKSSRNHEEVGISGRAFDQEVGDEILAKYRKKPVSMIEGDHLNTSNNSAESQLQQADKEREAAGASGDDDRQVIDPSNPENSYAFSDAKRKLRLVLSSADAVTLPLGTNSVFALRCNGNNENDKQRDNELVAFLKMQLAEAINLQDRSLVAQLLETLRCVQLFDKEGCKKLFKSLKEDYKKRAPYIAYLVRCRQGLLTTLSHLERILNRIERDKVVCNKFMISVCVRLFLEKRESLIQRFVEEFQKLTVSDEKTDLVEQLLNTLYRDMETDPLWQAASQDQTEQAQISIERNIMSQMYIHALYPNGDGDVMRDKLIQEHIQKLQKVLTPNHKYLRIPKMYQYEAPWPAAQAEITSINAFKTPRDKLHCVFRCCHTILNLLRLANEKSIPAADDFMPVLVFVLVHANPPNLLSTVQYVDSFYRKRIEGEEEYWWTQFCSAVEFIKTMEYDE